VLASEAGPAQPQSDQAGPASDANTGDAPNPLLTVAMEQQSRLNEEFGSTVYAYFGQLALAKAENDQGRLEPAAQALRAAIGKAPTPLLESLAGLRLARVLFAAGDYAGASAVIDQYDTLDSSFAADFAALRGDIALTENRVEDARAAYEQALDGDAATAGLVRLKLQDLPAPSDS
ncbi:YfgM family protein, partial [Thiorhodovibrio winogradskyi]|uniref:YfgM family protein n=1 Tax=Thiorhodovibrio winogradskyi TaxID=77007 RepID=UPI001912CB2F